MENTQSPQTVPSVNNDLAIVKEQIEFHEAQAAYHEASPWKQKKHLRTANRFRALDSRIQEILAENKALKEGAFPSADPKLSPKQLSLALTPDDIEGLPDAVIEALGLNTGDKTDLAIVSLIEHAGGVLTLDKILIGLYRARKEIHKRQQLVQRLYRLSQKGLAFPVPGKKGVYSLRKLTEEEAEKLFGRDQS